MGRCDRCLKEDERLQPYKAKHDFAKLLQLCDRCLTKAIWEETREIPWPSYKKERHLD